MAKAARKTVRKKATARKSASPRKASARQHSSSSRKSAKRAKDPRGGLTAAGRAAFRKRDGSNLKPGVKKKVADMTPQEMRRKGSWAVRFYGRAKLPPLVDENGEPTRHALSAHAWGEPVPKTVAAARRIAAKGHKLLDRYERLQETDARRSSAKKGSRPKTKRKTATPRKAAARKSSGKTSRKSPARKNSVRKTKTK